MINQTVNLSDTILTIEWTREDIFNAFMENGIDFNPENVENFLTEQVKKTLENECIAKGEEVLGRLVNEWNENK